MNLDAIKLVDEPGATDDEVNDYIEHIVQQSDGWGLRQMDRIFLSMARVALAGLEASNKLDEMHRSLKGQQMENGRLKKRIENLETQVAAIKEKALDSAE